MIAQLRSSARRLARAPGFTAVAVLSLAAGFGLSTGALALVEGLSKQPETGVTGIDRISELRIDTENRPLLMSISALEQMDALKSLPGVEAVTAARSINVTVETNGDVKREYIGRAPIDYFTFLGVRPMLGRFPLPEEVASEAAVLVSAKFWRRQFPDHPALSDAIVRINDRSYRVAGVMPPGLNRVPSWQVWLPLPSTAALANDQAMILLRRRDGVELAALKPALDAVAARLVGDRSPTAPRAAYRIIPFRAESFALGDFLWSLIIAGYAVLVVACVNVAALMLARGVVRRRDYALRLALGASRMSLAVDVCSELLLLAVGGIVAGGVVAYWSLHVLMSQIPEELVLDGFVPPEWNWRVVGIAGVSVVAAIVFAGAVPAWRATQTQPIEPLKESAGTTTGRAETRFHFLLIAEFAIAMVLVFSTTLMLRSTRKWSAYDFGYDASRLVLASVNLNAVRDSNLLRSSGRLANETVDRVRAVRGVASAAAFSRNAIEDGQVVSEYSGPMHEPVVLHHYWNVGAGFLATLGVPVSEGRDFSEGDAQGNGAVILTRHLAKLLFPDGNAIGHMVKLGGARTEGAWLPVVGITRDVDLDNRPSANLVPEPTLFLSAPDPGARSWSIAVRPTGDPAALSLRMSSMLRTALPVRAGTSVTPWLAAFEHSLRQKEFVNRIFTTLGITSLLLGAAGLFSVLSYAVGQRMREFEVRVALGAAPRDVVWLVVRSGLELTLGGIVIGTIASVWAGSFIGASLYGVQPNDPKSLVGTALALTLVTVLAALFPAWRAMRVDPVEVLRAT